MPFRSRNSLYALVAAAGSLVSAGPCDIYAQGDTPCVAAHSTTRALYDDYNGPLYQVRRSSDDRTSDIYPRSAGGVANAGAQDDFCAFTTCVISTIYDQSGNDNELTHSPPGTQGHTPNFGYNWESGATGAPVLVDGQKAYGVFINVEGGYRKVTGNNVPTGDEPEGMYWVVDGTHYNDQCCFDYGNAEPSSNDTGDGHMEALFFGTYGGAKGAGPWILADLENGLFMNQHIDNRPPNTNISHRFTVGTLKGEPHHWAIRNGDATRGSLNTIFDGARPNDKYDPMHKEGSVILGTGGDNSNAAQGTFYEGVLTKGYPSDDTEQAVHDDIARQNYRVTSMNSGPSVTLGSVVSFRATTSCCTTRYIARDPNSDDVKIDFANDEGQKQRARWTVRQGLATAGCYSFESVEQPGNFIRHSANGLKVNRNDGSKLFSEDATFCLTQGINHQGSTIRSWSYPFRYWRHYDARLYIAANGGPYTFDTKNSFSDDASFVIGGDPMLF